jgi:hypothetical protein
VAGNFFCNWLCDSDLPVGNSAKHQQLKWHYQQAPGPPDRAYKTGSPDRAYKTGSWSLQWMPAIACCSMLDTVEKWKPDIELLLYLKNSSHLLQILLTFFSSHQKTFSLLFSPKKCSLLLLTKKILLTNLTHHRAQKGLEIFQQKNVTFK